MIANCHELIISQELFDETHINSKKCIRAKRGKRNCNPFYYCGVCGRALSLSKKVKGDILLCYSSRIEDNFLCKDNRVELVGIEETIMKTINIYAAAYFDEKRVKKYDKGNAVSCEESIAALEKNVKNLSSRKIVWYSKYKDDRISREEYVTCSKSMVEQIDEMNQKIRQIKAEMTVDDNTCIKLDK